MENLLNRVISVKRKSEVVISIFDTYASPGYHGGLVGSAFVFFDAGLPTEKYISHINSRLLAMLQAKKISVMENTYTRVTNCVLYQ